jgi:hypothetical protein
MNRIRIGKKWWALCLPLLAMLSIASPLLTQSVAADCGSDSGQTLTAVLSDKSISNATVTATRENQTLGSAFPATVKLGWNGGQKDYSNNNISVDVTGNSSDFNSNDFRIDVVQNGKQIGSTGSYVGLDCNNSTNTKTIQVASAAQQATTAGLDGTITFTDPSDKKTVPYDSNTKVTITGPKSFSPTVNANGSFSIGSGLPAGSYTINADDAWVRPNSPSSTVGNSYSLNYKSTFTIAAADLGKVKHLGTVSSGTATAGTPPGAIAVSAPGTPTVSDTPTCESSGFSLNWLFCGLYDGLSSSSDWILTNLIEPELKTSPLCLSSTGAGCQKNDVTYKVWSNFRIYGDVFLVIASLVVVFGESLGGGLIDAYTVKKMVPRILAAAILINLSIYIVAFMLDLANIIGGGIGELITSPLTAAKAFNISPQGGVGAGELAAGGLVAGFLGAKALAGIFSGGTGGAGFSLILNVVLVPTFLIFLAILATIAVRKAIIISLVFVSPVAFALYTLPNTEKYFKRWWSLLLEMLTIYPIIVLLFAVSDVLSVTVEQPSADSATASAGVNYLLSFVFLIIPLFLIPFSFKIAGGILGRVHDLVDGGRKKAHALNEGRRERSKANFKAANVQARQNRSSALLNQASKGGAFRRKTVGRGLGMLARGYGGYNIEADASATRAQVGKEINDQIATGADAEVRGLSVNKAWAARQGAMTKSADGKYMQNDFVRQEVDADGNLGVKQYKSLGGAWINEGDVDAGHKRWGNNTFAQQASLAYEMRKASSEEQVKGIADNYGSVAQGWGMSDQQAGGAWIGAAFEHQNQHLEYKYTDWKTGNLSKPSDFVNEVYEKKGSYQMGQMGSHTIDQLKSAYNVASGLTADGSTDPAGRVDVDQQEKIRAISETFMNDYGAGGGAPEDKAAELDAARPDGGSRRQANTPGAAHVAERVRELAVLTGVHPESAKLAVPTGDGKSPSGQYTDPSHAPNPTGSDQNNRREQH